GIGTNAGSAILTGSRSFLLGESEWSRVVAESGPILGYAYILLRLAICVYLILEGWNALGRGEGTPILLVAASLVDMASGQFGQPSTLGFAVFTAGVALASMNRSGAPSPSTESNATRAWAEALSDRLRTVVQTIAPGFIDWFRSYRQRKYFCKQFKWDQRIFRVAFYPENMTPEVLTGPFCGMKYLDEIVWGPITPKWAGAYEMELADIVAAIPGVGYDRIVNIGCAEGYYVVGLALLDRKADLFAFDRDPFARCQLKRLAELNGVSERVRIAGNCTHSTLNEAIRGKVLVICDVEGFEIALM